MDEDDEVTVTIAKKRQRKDSAYALKKSKKDKYGDKSKTQGVIVEVTKYFKLPCEIVVPRHFTVVTLNR